MEELILVDSSADIEIVLSEEPVVEIVTEGVQGPPGTAGRDAQQYRLFAQSPIGGHRAVMLDGTGVLRYASSKISSHASRVIGVTTNAASPGFEVNIILQGDVDEPSWSWIPEQPIWLGDNGLLTQTEPSPDSGDSFSLVVGFAVTPTKVFVRIQYPLFLA